MQTWVVTFNVAGVLFVASVYVLSVASLFVSGDSLKFRKHFSPP